MGVVPPLPSIPAKGARRAFYGRDEGLGRRMNGGSRSRVVRGDGSDQGEAASLNQARRTALGLLPPRPNIQSAQEVGNSARQRFLENVGIQHTKLVADGADYSTATIPRGSEFSYQSLGVRWLGGVAHGTKPAEDLCSRTP